MSHDHEPAGPWWHKAIFYGVVAFLLIAINHGVGPGLAALDAGFAIACIGGYFTPDDYMPR